MNEIGISSSSYTDISITECMKRIRNAGYDSVDFNLYDFCQANGPMLSSDWKEWLKKVRQGYKGCRSDCWADSCAI